MLEKIIELDKEILIFLNGLGSPTFDGLWLIITKQVYWALFFLYIFTLLKKRIGWKSLVYYLVFTAFLILVCDQTANLFKVYFHRLRPCNDETVNHLIRVVKTSPSFSFFSAHAANSMATTLFTYLIMRKHFKYTYLLFLFPLIFAYSRIYLGLHYPGDVLTGYVFGAVIGFLCYKLYSRYVFQNPIA